MKINEENILYNHYLRLKYNKYFPEVQNASFQVIKSSSEDQSRFYIQFRVILNNNYLPFGLNYKRSIGGNF